MLERTYRTRIDDLANVGEELMEEHLRLVAGAAGKKRQTGPGQRYEGTSTAACSTTYVQDSDGAMWCETDGDFD
jgi:hypothetical protein